MTIKSDNWIKQKAQSDGMIGLFEENQVRVTNDQSITYTVYPVMVMMLDVPTSLKSLQTFTLPL